MYWALIITGKTVALFSSSDAATAKAECAAKATEILITYGLKASCVLSISI